MVSDTQKRGRPKTWARQAAEIGFPEMETRAAENLLYAMSFIDQIMGREHPFFLTSKGNVRRQGIAEQLGRMLDAELITPEQCKELAQQAIDEYNNGASVKEITKTLTTIRLNLQKRHISL